ncbi:MAG TPA: helix-turn-helix domain-containing protein [Candidatus Saccharimonadales bacterium]|nr:helix-turn-helix domain-containing protein [Candidatus Saccharimonadales bacterium]
MLQSLRSDCPLNFALETLGDKWSLLIVRDMVFSGKLTYKEMLESNEKIATNILAQRLKMLEHAGIIEKQFDAERKSKTKQTYILTERGIDLIPTMVEMMLWSDTHSELKNSPDIITDARKNKEQAIAHLQNTVRARIAEVKSSATA